MKLPFKAFLFSLALILTILPFNVTHAAITDNMAGFWTLNETSGTRTDSMGASTLSETGGTVSSTTGKIGNAATFSGSNYLSATDSSTLSTGDIDFTVAGWVYLESKTGNKAIISKWDSSTNNKEYALSYISTSDRFTFFASGDGTSNLSIAANAFGSPQLNTWYYVVAWHDTVNNTLNIQVNDGTVSTRSSYTAGVFDGAAPFALGSYDNSVFLSGRIDAVGFWKRALTSGERTALYNSGNGYEYAMPASVPSTISSVVPTAGDTQVALAWTAPAANGDAITDYIVEYKLTNDSGWTTFSDGVSTSTSATVTSLTNGSSYDFRVSAVNGIGTGATSSVVSSTPSTAPGVVAITHPDLFWSPYNWRFNGSTYAQSTPGGAYINVAFTGTTLALGIDTSVNTGVDLSTIKMHAYIDGSTTPIEKNLSSVSGGVMTFTSALSSGSHYATIYLSKTVTAHNRWAVPVNVARITKVQLASSGTILSLANTPLAEKDRTFLIYGDSITEGVGSTQAESAFSAVLSRTLNAEYGQVGYSGLGWSRAGGGSTAHFYETTPANSLWRKYDANTSRLVNNADLSSGFIDGAPEAVFVNLGTNDANLNTGAPAVQTKTAAWLSEIREVVGSSSDIFIIVPFIYGNTSDSNYATYKAALLGGVTDYQNTNPSDTKVFVLDLGTAGHDIVAANSTDAIHPNNAGSAILGEQLAVLVSDRITAPSITNVAVSGVSATSATITWTTDEASDTQVQYGISSLYGSATVLDSTLVTSHSVQLTGLLPDTTYHFRVVSKDAFSNSTMSSDTTFVTQDEVVDPTPETPRNRVVGGSYAPGTSPYLAPVSTDIRACRPGDLFSPATGAKCSTASNNPSLPTPAFTRSLSLGMRGEDVRALQVYLNTHGFAVAPTGVGSKGFETMYFGPATRAAVIKFQIANKITPAVGFFGPISRGFIVN